MHQGLKGNLAFDQIHLCLLHKHSSAIPISCSHTFSSLIYQLWFRFRWNVSKVWGHSNPWGNVIECNQFWLLGGQNLNLVFMFRHIIAAPICLSVDGPSKIHTTSYRPLYFGFMSVIKLVLSNRCVTTILCYRNVSVPKANMTA